MNFKYTEELICRVPELAEIKDQIKEAISALINCHNSGNKTLLAGSGGSAADSEHISGEMLKGFLLKRQPQAEELKALSEAIGEEHAIKLQRGIRAIPLTSLSALSTAFSNDVDPLSVFAQGVYALGQSGDVFIGLSTSGNSVSVCRAAKVAKALGITVIGMTGRKGGNLCEIADICIKAPANETFRIQEYHLPIYHAICADVENNLFG